MRFEDVEYHMWPPAGMRSGTRSGVLAIHLPTGVSVIVTSESSPQRRRKLAEERLAILVSEAEIGLWSR